MPLVIECPNGCRLRASEDKAGSIVKCPVCKSHIQIAPLSEARIETTRSVVKAKIRTESSQAGPLPADQEASGNSPNPRRRQESRIASGGDRVPAAENKSREPNSGRSSNISQPSDPSIESFENDRIDPVVNELPAVLIASDKSLLPETIDIPEFEEPVKKASLEEIQTRIQNSNEDRVLLARLYAGLLCLVGLMNLMPFLVSWFQAMQTGDTFQLSRWMYLQIFLSGLHFIYAVFLLQIPDWSALRTVAVTTLCFAVLFGVCATGLVVGENGGQIAKTLELPFDLITRATYWCVAMLVLTTIFSFVAGREATNWKRTEELVGEILAKRGQQ